MRCSRFRADDPRQEGAFPREQQISTNLPIYLPTCLSAYVFLSLSTYLPSFLLSIIYLSVSIFLSSVYLPIYTAIYLLSCPCFYKSRLFQLNPQPCSGHCRQGLSLADAFGAELADGTYTEELNECFLMVRKQGGQKLKPLTRVEGPSQAPMCW